MTVIYPQPTNRQNVIAALKQLRKEGYVTEGFKLTVNTYLLLDEYEDAYKRKQAHEAKLLQAAYECQQAFEARRAAQQELDQHIEEQAEEYESCDINEGLANANSVAVNKVYAKQANTNYLHMCSLDFFIRSNVKYINEEYKNEPDLYGQLVLYRTLAPCCDLS